jgi:hypothetical protein
VTAPVAARAPGTAVAPRPPSLTKPAVSRAPRRPAAAEGDAYLTVNATPWGAVYVDGRRLAEETPVYRRRIASGDHVVVIHYPDGHASSPQRVHVGAGETRAVGFTR